MSHAPLFGHQCEDRQPPGLFRSIGFLRRGGRFVFTGSLVTRCARTRLRYAVRILGGASTAGTRGGHGDPRALREHAITLRSPYGRVRYDRFWPISSVTGIRPTRQLSGDKLPARAELLRRRPSRIEQKRNGEVGWMPRRWIIRHLTPGALVGDRHGLPPRLFGGSASSTCC